MKYIINLEPIDGTNLWKAKGFNTLVFDEMGIKKLEPYIGNTEFKPGDLIRNINGTKEYRFISYSKGKSHINAIITDTEVFAALPNNGKYIKV